MIKWIITLILSSTCSIICYITNPIVVLFSSEEGELPGLLRLWQTWDDSLDGAFQVSCMPAFLRYDFHAKYDEHSRQLEEYNRTQYYVTLKPGATFTLKERLQRYCCRLGWLTRNCGYGFAFYLFGETIRPYLTEKIIDQQYVKFACNGNPDLIIFDTIWTYQDSRRELSILGYNFYRNFYLGYKFNPDDKDTQPTRIMMANRIAWKIRKGEPKDGLID